MFKKIILLFTSLAMILCLSACSSQQRQSTSVQLKKGITLSLRDVWKITNSDANTTYYYYLATIKNKTKKEYSIQNLTYKISDGDGNKIKSIDSSQSSPFSTVYKGENAYIYGYVGYPNKNQKDVGLYFNKNKYIPFDTVAIRESNDTEIKKQGTGSFRLFSSDELDISVNTEKATDSFENGTTTLSNVYITYKNKTNKPLVIPYFIPHVSLNGLDLSQYSDKGDFASMTEEEFKKVDFTKDGMAPKTSEIDGQASGYIVYYLRPKQTIQCNVHTVFDHAAIDYSDTDKKVFTMVLESAPFGSSTKVIITRK